jgi:hypothetical protein
MRNAASRDPLYDVDWINGRAVEVFYADAALAREFDGSAGWYWRSRRPATLRESNALGPFPTSYRAFKHATECTNFLQPAGRQPPALPQSD